MAATQNLDSTGFLDGVRILEIGNELGEYCGKLMAGLGADVVRVEPLGGEMTRSYGPFCHDEPNPDRSLHFWHYNLGKRAVALDLDSTEGQEHFRALAQVADVVIDSRPRGYFAERSLDFESLEAANPGLIWSRITPFGDDGPWADYQGSDLVHLALGGVMMNCGYDPDPSGYYETPPVAPQMWQAYQITGEMAAMAVLGALIYRLSTAQGQFLTTSVHQAVSQNTETDLPDWIFLAHEHRRLTCRHSMAVPNGPSLSITKDGRYLLPYRTYVNMGVDAWAGQAALLKDYGMQRDLEGEKFATPESHLTPEAIDYIGMLTDNLIRSLLFDRDLWREAQAYGQPWAPIRHPEENIDDDHWRLRGAFFDIYHEELGETFTYTGAKWLTHGVAWKRGPRPPLMGEHTDEVLSEWTGRTEHRPRVVVAERRREEPAISERGKPFALSGVRVVDLGWMVASAGPGRFLSAMGAEVIKVEHSSRIDGIRYGGGSACPPGGRDERDRATGPLPTPEMNSPNRSGFFMELNAGKLGLSLNVKHPEGRGVLEDLIRNADVLLEGYSPGTMTRMGLGYDKLKELNPSIIYVQQSGFGEAGTYGSARAFGPTAQAFTGISDMSGLPEPYPPAGIGYSYLDWFGAYNVAVATLAALHRRRLTGEGCHIDASQAETGLYLTGTAILDYTVNGRRWSRYGNRSPYKPAAPHGAYRTDGADRWIAIAAFTDEQWLAVTDVLDIPQAAGDERFKTLARRLENQDALDTLVESATAQRDGVSLMAALQARQVPAGMCQTAQDRYESDPQLAHLEWLAELNQSEIGRWPVREHPTKMSETPSYIGGLFDRSGPSYGEDTDYVLSKILGMTPARVAELREIGAL